MKFQSKRPVESTTYELTAVSFGTEHCVLQLIRAVGIEGTTIKATGTLAMSMGEIREVAEALMHYTETGELMEAEGEA